MNRHAIIRLPHTALRRIRPSRRAFLPILAAAAITAAVGAVAAQVPEAPALPGKIVYQRARANLWTLFIADADGGNEVHLTTANSGPGKGDDQPRWSWNGREIAFASFSSDGDRAFIWRVPYTGGTPTPVATADADDAGSPAWSPDDQSIVFAGVHSGGGPETLDLNVWTSEGTRALLDTPDVNEREPDWSPDGRRIVYTARRVDDTFWSELRVVDADGTNDRLLLEQPGLTIRYPAWSPDGRTIAFATYVNQDGYGSGTLWLLDVATGAQTEVVAGVFNPVSWSPDGAWLLVYNTLEKGLEFPGRPPPTAQPANAQLFGLFVIRLEDGGLFRLKGAAGGAAARPRQFEWGQAADWTAGTFTPTPEIRDTATFTPSPTATYTPTPTATDTATLTPSPTPTMTPTDTPSATPTPAIYLPMGVKEFSIGGEAGG